MTDQEQKDSMKAMIAELLSKAQPTQPSPFAAPFSAQSTGFAEITVELEVKAADGSGVNLHGKLPNPQNITPANLKDTLSAYLAAGWPLKFWAPKNTFTKKF
jgi:hypothetical protein